MRKTLSFSIALCLVLSLFAGIVGPVAKVEAQTTGVWAYSLDGGGVTVTGYAGPGGTVTIPDIVGGYPVTGIGASAFAGTTTLSAVTVPGSVTSIGNGAFSMCTGLTAAYFLGNAPSGTPDMFTGCGSGFTIYHAGDKTGWTASWYGYPAATFGALSWLSLTPAAGAVRRVNDTVTLTLHFDVTGGARANAFVATINYDPTYLTYVSCVYDTTGHPFPTQVEVTAAPGTVQIAGGRGNSLGFAPAGDIATITFAAAAETPTYTTVSFNAAADTYSGQAASGVWQQGATFVQGVAVPTLTADADVTVKNDRTITASASENGSISPSGDTSVPYGTNASFTITPITDYHVLDVLVDGVSVGALTTYAFTNVTANHTISASFDANFWVVTLAANSRIAGATPRTQNVTKGETATFHVTPTTGDYSYIYSTSCNGASAVPLATAGDFFGTRNYGQSQDLVFPNITGPTTIVANLFRRSNINGGSGTLVPDDADAVNGSDASVLIAQWRKTQGTGTGQVPLLVADLDNNRKVDVVDLSLMMSLWTGDGD
ncbi:MAG: cohesin domain-containing protein [Candidatus Cryosericum sp.]